MTERNELTDLKRTSLNGIHKNIGARMVPFAGWEMPVQYDGIIAEANAVRQTAGLFDVSHMGRVLFSGSDASNLLDRIFSLQVSNMKIGQARYTVICNHDGYIIDDCIVYRLGMELFLLIPNASNLETVLDWIKKFVTENMNVKISDVTTDTAMIAVQGPLSESIISKAASEARLFDFRNNHDVNCDDSTNLKNLRSFRVMKLSFDPISTREYNLFANPEGIFSEDYCSPLDGLIARTGYTGENGFEIIVHRNQSEKVWSTLHKYGAIPAGLGSRDLLRLEAGMVLYGNDIDLTTNPYEAGLGRFVKPDREGYISREALMNFREFPSDRKLVGFKMRVRNIPRHGYKIALNGDNIGEVTSGGFSPVLGTSVGMGFVEKGCSDIGNFVQIDIRGRFYDAEIVKMPFYVRG